jgi:hydrogenase maturation protein HypF
VEAQTVTGTEPALAAAQRTLLAGGTVAVKGVGGFHLACDATSPAAVTRLRARKQRPDKPFAVMVADLEAARAIVQLGAVEAAALTSPQRPVVLARTRRSGIVADAVAPNGNPLLGVMLPSSPLHELLLTCSPDGAVAVPPVLVMTSGNLSGEPICFTDEDAEIRLAGIVDGVLAHDRPIHVPCDDSVVQVVDGEVVPLRRSRGDTPLPLRLPVDAGPMLAVGAELKNTVGVARGHQAWLSQHIGDLGDLETLRAFERTAEQLASFFAVTPAHVAVDPHPAYATHAWARRHHRDRLEPVQHHHAHAAALLAEHGLPADEIVLVATFDGTGYGTDHTVWGGELLLASQRSADRAAHLVPLPLPGGDSAVANPARMALAALWSAGLDWDEELACTAALTGPERDLLLRQLERDLGCVPTSSAGRLFDAVSALVGVRQHITYEGQAAIELEWLADTYTAAGHRDADAPRYHLDVGDGTPITLDPAPMLRAIVTDLRADVDVTAIAAGFHLAIADAVVEVADRVAADGGPRTVGLTGGVFQNAWLTTRTRRQLEAHDHPVLTHHLVPPNDGGLAYGQLAAVAARLRAPDTD